MPGPKDPRDFGETQQSLGFDTPMMPGVQLDGRRQFRGEPQLTRQEQATLSKINRFGLMLVHVNSCPNTPQTWRGRTRS
jgi:hypothetical protein